MIDLFYRIGESAEALATLVTVFSAIVIGGIGLAFNAYWQNRRHIADAERQKRQHTLDLLNMAFLNPAFQYADYHVLEMTLKGGSLKFDEVDDDTRKSLRLMCYYYEVLAHSVIEGICDEKTIEKFRSGSLIEFYEIIETHYLPSLRDKLKRATIYSGLEDMAKRFREKGRKMR